MQPLNFPSFDFVIRHAEGRAVILDTLRQKFVRLTPEEWVRQHLVRYLVSEKGVPPSLVALEMGFQYEGLRRRADVVVYNRQARAVLMAECKAPSVSLTQSAFDQIGRYNLKVRARYLLVTNGLVHYSCRVDFRAQSYTFLQDIPEFHSLG